MMGKRGSYPNLDILTKTVWAYTWPCPHFHSSTWSQILTRESLARDQDIDCVYGNGYGLVFHFENVGTASVPLMLEQVGLLNPLRSVAQFAEESVAPFCADFDGE